MAEPEVRVNILEMTSRDIPQDVDMAGADTAEVDEALEVLGGTQNEDAEEEQSSAPKQTFVDFLRSPIIEIVVGAGEAEVVLTAHQALLQASPFFANAISAFSPDAATRRIEFPKETLETMGAFLQFLYTSEYTPRKHGDGLEDVAGDASDADGAQLLFHARVYTLAEKLGLLGLKSLAHSKVHRINATAKGEIEYARYVYANTPRTDVTIRKPIASFWGQRSHVLRHEAEEDFRQLCLDHPDFGFDVLSYVLDARERRGKEKEDESLAPKSARKRQRNQ